MSIKMATYSVKLLEKQELATNVFQLRFVKPEGFSYDPGQFVQFLIPNGEKQTPRSYSISSIPGDEYLEFCIKFHDGGLASEYFRSMKSGHDIDMRGPLGRFVIDENAAEHYFIATGVGIAPMMGMLRTLIEEKKVSHPIRLLFGVRSESDLFWTKKFDELKQKHSLFDYAITLSQPTQPDEWEGLEGRVTEHILHNIGTHKFYLCGSAEMVKDVRTLLLENGVEAKDVHFEIF